MIRGSHCPSCHCHLDLPLGGFSATWGQEGSFSTTYSASPFLLKESGSLRARITIHRFMICWYFIKLSSVLKATRGLRCRKNMFSCLSVSLCSTTRHSAGHNQPPSQQMKNGTHVAWGPGSSYRIRGRRSNSAPSSFRCVAGGKVPRTPALSFLPWSSRTKWSRNTPLAHVGSIDLHEPLKPATFRGTPNRHTRCGSFPTKFQCY